MPLFTAKPVVFVGLISYSLYLWHFPIAAFGKRLLGRDFLVPEQVILIGLSVVLAILSWRFIEQPFRGQRGTVTSGQLKWFVSLGMASVVSFGIFTDAANGAWWRFGLASRGVVRS